MNHWSSNSPTVIFGQTLNISLNFFQPSSQFEDLNPSLYPHHPFSIGQYTLFKNRLSIKSPGKEVVTREIKNERERIEVLKKYFGLLEDVEIEKALKNIGGMISELK